MNEGRVVPVIALVIFIAGVDLAQGGEVYFLPGDAFFHTRLGEGSLKRLEQSEPATFTYSRPTPDSLNDGGWTVGFRELRIPGLSDATISELETVYRDIRKYENRVVEEVPRAQGGIIEVERNAPHVFVYSDDFRYQRRQLFLKYNENWLEDEMALGISRTRARLEEFLPVKTWVSWRDAELVPPLNVTQLETPDAAEPKRVVVADSDDDLQFIVVSHSDFELYVRHGDAVLAPSSPIEVYVLVSGRRESWILESGRFERLEE